MHYICIEEDTVVSILDYQPNAPESIKIVEISDKDANKLFRGEYYFDIAANSIKKKKTDKQQKINLDAQTILDTTDWMVLRHIREKALGLTSSLTDEQYLELEQKRQSAAEAIKNA